MGVSGTNMAAWSGRQRLGALSMVGDPVGRRDLATRSPPRESTLTKKNPLRGRGRPNAALSQRCHYDAVWHG